MMKRFSLATLVVGLVIIASAIVINGLTADDIKGTYWNAEKTAHIRMYKAKNGKYYGKIEHLVEPNDASGNPKKDPENSKEELRNRDRLGMVIAKGFTWDADENEWNDGIIYNPTDGKTYDGYMYFEGDDKKNLYLRGFVLGMPFLGKTSEWSRIK